MIGWFLIWTQKSGNISLNLLASQGHLFSNRYENSSKLFETSGEQARRAIETGSDGEASTLLQRSPCRQLLLSWLDNTAQFLLLMSPHRIHAKGARKTQNNLKTFAKAEHLRSQHLLYFSFILINLAHHKMMSQSTMAIWLCSLDHREDEICLLHFHSDLSHCAKGKLLLYVCATLHFFKKKISERFWSSICCFTSQDPKTHTGLHSQWWGPKCLGHYLLFSLCTSKNLDPNQSS